MSSSSQPGIFIDSSVLIAAAISARGAARDLINAGVHGSVALSWSDLVIAETARNLNAKAPEAVDAFDRFRDAAGFFLTVPDPDVLQRALTIVDAKDAPIVAAAASASWIASYDRRHLLAFHGEIKSAFDVCVATPNDIMSNLG